MSELPRWTVSEEVHAFYEAMPYPAPLTSLDEHRDLYSNPDRRRVQVHLLWPAEPMRGGQQILVAGCGTSQAARYALREPDARITAIDSAGDRLLGAIDGQRTLAEILRFVAQDAVGERQALGFFERL